MSDLPRSMEVAVYKKPRVVEIETRALPEVGPDEVLIEVSHCGICGTDLHLMLEGMGRPDTVGGHEYSGAIVALGDGVRGFSLGDTVVGGEPTGCGECAYCVSGRPALCGKVTTRRGPNDPPRLSQDGNVVHQFLDLSSYAERMLVHEHAVVKITRTCRSSAPP